MICLVLKKYCYLCNVNGMGSATARCFTTRETHVASRLFYGKSNLKISELSFSKTYTFLIFTLALISFNLLFETPVM